MAPSPLERGITAALERAGESMWGFRPRLMGPTVRQLGPLRALRWFGWNMPRYEQTLKAFGGLRTHLLSTTTSLVRGCAYCSFGHAYAFELIYLREHGVLFPLDEYAITGLCTLDPVVIRDRLADALHEAGLGGEVAWLDRMLELQAGSREPRDRDDMRVGHLIRMFAVLNACGIAGDVTPDQAHDPTNKDRALKHRYLLLRGDSGG